MLFRFQPLRFQGCNYKLGDVNLLFGSNFFNQLTEVNYILMPSYTVIPWVGLIPPFFLPPPKKKKKTSVSCQSRVVNFN